jgi:competence CoiA-like predicted nuclease
MAKEVAQEEVVGDQLLQLAVEYTSSNFFTSKVDQFVEEHAHLFLLTAAESKRPEEQEMPLEYNDIFLQYQQLIDGLFEQFAASNKFPISAVYQCFRDSADGKFTALFQENEYLWYVEQVMSWMDFGEFIKLMRAAGRTGGHKAESKSSGEGKDQEK